MRMWLTVLMSAVVLAAGCSDSAESTLTLQERSVARAAETRGYIDDLVERLGGTGVVVVRDAINSCDPVDSDSGLLHDYTVKFAVPSGAVEQLEGGVADAFESQGWTVRRDATNSDSGEVSVRFLQGTFSMGVKATPADGTATAGGSGGCVK